MNPIEDIYQRLQKYPELRYNRTDHFISIEAPSPTGFSVTFEINGNRSVVSFEGWHESFESVEEALNCFAFGLSDSCRLKVHRRGTFEHKWTLEYRTESGWSEDSTVGLLFFPFWATEEIVYRQNSIIVDR